VLVNVKLPAASLYTLEIPVDATIKLATLSSVLSSVKYLFDPSAKSEVVLDDKSKFAPVCKFTLASALAFVKYSFVPSVILLVDNEISALPLKATPAIFLEVSNVVAVVAFPVNAPVKVVAATEVNPLILGFNEIVKLFPVELVDISFAVPTTDNTSVFKSIACCQPASP